MGFEIRLSLAAWREHIHIFRKIKEKGLDVNVSQDKAYRQGGGPAGYDKVLGSYDNPANKEKARWYVCVLKRVRSGNTKVHPDFVQDAEELGLCMNAARKRKRA